MANNRISIMEGQEIINQAIDSKEPTRVTHLQNPQYTTLSMPDDLISPGNILFFFHKFLNAIHPAPNRREFRAEKLGIKVDIIIWLKLIHSKQ
jgi:hypothetical protein